MKQSANHQPPPPPRFYNYSAGYPHANNHNNLSSADCTNINDGSHHSDTSKNSLNDLSVLSPNLKSFLDKNVAKNEHNSTCHIAVDARDETQQLFSPHLAALTSPPPTRYGDDGLLHSVLFSARKYSYKKRRKKGGNKRSADRQEEEEDVLALFSPGVEEFDLEEALAAENENHEHDDVIDVYNNYDRNGQDYRNDELRNRQEESNINDDEMTLDSVDRIVRGDYLARNQGRGAVVATSFTSPTATLSKTSVAATATVEVTTPIMDNAVKTSPKYSTPNTHNNSNNIGQEEEQEYFYTPVQDKSDWSAILSTASRGSRSLSSTLAPVWEVEEGNDDDEVEEVEEFFSPLAVQHRVVDMTSSKQWQKQQVVESESHNDTVMREWENKKKNSSNQQRQLNTASPTVASPKYSEMKEELQQMLAEAKSLTPRKEEADVPSTKTSPMNEIVSDDANEDKENVPPAMTTRTAEVAMPSPIQTRNTDNVMFHPSSPPTTIESSLSHSPPNNTPNSHHHHYHHHLHSSTSSSRPSDQQLTFEFVKECDCLDTLKEILSRLSAEDYDGTSNYDNEGGRGKKKLKYPSMVKYVEKRMKIVAASMAPEQNDQLVNDIHSSIEAGNEYEDDDKENVMPEDHREHSGEANNTSIPEGHRSVLSPLETAQFASAPEVDGNEVAEDQFRHRQITPENHSIEERSGSMTYETSLDMDLSASMEDESFYWRQEGEKQEKVDTWESSLRVVEDNEGVPLDVSEERHVKDDAVIDQPALEDVMLTPSAQQESYAELQKKLSSSLAAHAELTERVESLVREHAVIKAELMSKLDQAKEQLSQQQHSASAEKEEYMRKVSELMQVNQTLEQEISNMKERLVEVDKRAHDAASQLQHQFDQTELIRSKLSKENERLERELEEARQACDRGSAEELRLKQMLDEQIANADANNNASIKRMQKGLEAAKFANHALANALAISERDLSEALRQKEKSVRECNSLRERMVELEDKSSWLSSRVNKMTQELQSSHKYIDTLYANLQSSRSPSKEMKAEMERRELQWLELEHQYTRRIQELERQSGGAKISMADYVIAVRECRQYQSEVAQKQQIVEELESTISTLKQQMETMQRRPSPRSGLSTSMANRGKSISALRCHGKKVHNEPSASIQNDENKAPSLGQRGGAASGEGKKVRRSAALKAVGGRKGLSEQLRRSRRVGENN